MPRQLGLPLKGMMRRYKTEDEIATEKILMAEQLEHPDPEEEAWKQRERERLRREIERLQAKPLR